MTPMHVSDTRPVEAAETHPAERDNPDVGDCGSEWIAVLVYFAAYLAFLFGTLEGEAGHWLTLVAVPLLMVALLRRSRGLRAGPAATLASVGLRRGRLRQGLALAAAVGLALAALQLAVSRSRSDILDLLTSTSALYILPVAFILMLTTAAFTEEFFFRGVLLTRLRARFGTPVSVVVSAALFGLYHLPYALLHPSWPSHGDAAAAFVSAMTQGGIGGLILGAMFVAARGNLLAPVLVHTMINLPVVAAMLPGMIRFGPT